MGKQSIEIFDIENVAMATKDTEYSYTIPKGTEKITIKLRDPSAILRLYNETGGSEYLSIPQSSSFTIEGMKFQDKTFYVQSDTDTQVLEVAVFQ